MYSNCHLTVKFLENYPDSKEETVYLITDEKVSTKSLFSKFDELFDSFGSINIKMGVLKDDPDGHLECLDGPCFYIGNEPSFNKSLKKLNNSQAYMSKKASTQACHIGYQRHFGNPQNKQSISLGDLNRDIDQAKAVLRNLDSIVLNMDAIKKSDSFFNGSWISGMTIEQACLLTRTAASTSKNKFFSIDIGHESPNDNCIENLCLLFWYYLEGVKNRKIEDPENVNSQVYLVESEFFDHPIQFIKNKVTNSWWLKDPNSGELKACSKQDYLEASKGNIPDALLSLSNL